MSRARKNVSAAPGTNWGMNWLEIMPPALSPLNWWGAPLAAFQNSHALLSAWRASADSLREAMRQQQDTFCAICEASLARREEARMEAPPASAGASEGENEPAVADFMTPMLEAGRAYGRVGRAFIAAQRDTMRAFTQAGRPN